MQSRLWSFIEVVTSVTVGFIIGVLSNIIVLPLFGLYASVTDSILISVIFTCIGVVRSYIIRRVFNKLNVICNNKSDLYIEVKEKIENSAKLTKHKIKL